MLFNGSISFSSPQKRQALGQRSCMILLGKKQGNNAYIFNNTINLIRVLVNKMPTTTLTKELEELARKELNEVPNQRQEAIEYIQEWLRIQPHLRFRTGN